MNEEQVREMFRRLDTPPTANERRIWASSSRLVATIWCCGDEVDGLCYEPQIDRVTPNTEVGYPWVRREAVWRGTFVNEPEPGECDNLAAELRTGAALYGIPLTDEDGFVLHGSLTEPA